MAQAQSEHEDAAEPVTDHVHYTSWSANLETPAHADDQAVVLEQAEEAIDRTASGYHVNLVTHEAHGHPAEYLYSMLEELDAERDIGWEYVDQCGCGGHVTRVYVE